ncbi:unnamed protein product [Linum tenue]|uniref:Uncharacterized protein n=1 Tax=Linum tenue TaxID=586396 RepID=A0AAV0NRT0_9ROSI|nr:unnamed protein product [Linum tenue]
MAARTFSSNPPQILPFSLLLDTKREDEEGCCQRRSGGMHRQQR